MPTGPYPAFCIIAKQKESSLSANEWKICESSSGPYPDFCGEKVSVMSASGETLLSISQYSQLFSADNFISSGKSSNIAAQEAEEQIQYVYEQIEQHMPII
ncbi:MAG: hypothetical protein U9Q15_04565 [Patescibacteria group bacterium]|nr:hypothetical protein [Patescibacteria group bacterium]